MIEADICVIGAGSGGLVTAAAAAQFGRRTVLIEGHEMGGDCLNSGCVPSKALLAAAKAAHGIRKAQTFGVTAGPVSVDWEAVRRHVQGVIAAIAPHDSEERFRKLGCTVIRALARFTSPDTVEAGGERITARRFVIATGSRAAVPPIPGLDTVDFLTNETVFRNPVLPRHLIIIGGGPIGMEMAQAHRRLGAEVTVIEAATPLAKDDPELSALVVNALRNEGVAIHDGAKVDAVSRADGGITLDITRAGIAQRLTGSHLLIAAGRRPNIESLGLEAAGITATARGVTVDRGLKTTNRRVYAIGDVTGGPQFTHAAGHQAGLVIRNALFRLPVDSSRQPMPWVTYTDPELAHAGLTLKEARERHGDRVSVHIARLAGNDRAVADARTDGLVKIWAAPGGRILGAGIVGANAGELIAPWALAVANGLKLKAFVDTTFPYPTVSEAGRRAAVESFSGLASNPWVRRVIGLLGHLG